MNKLIAFIFSVMLGASLAANECEIESFDLNWTAFKTPEKVGVKGSFDRLNFEASAEKDDCAFSYLTMATVHIETASVNTGNEGRDATLVKEFFRKMAGEHIDAIIKRIDMEKQELSVEITMNDVSQTIYMPYTFDNKRLKAEGKLDLLNFSASDALQSLNEACYDLHKGKTWSDVEVAFTLVLKEACK